MSLTNTERAAGSAKRSGGVRDLRFAGTVAAGLVAGVLGVGALSAPLLGWSEWPDALQFRGGDDGPVRMAAPTDRTAIANRGSERSGGRSINGPTGPVLPGGAVIVPGTDVPVSDGAGGATTVPVSAPGGGGDGERVRVGSGSRRDGSGNGFGGSGFVPPNTADTDGDGMPDVWEEHYNLYPLRHDADGDIDGDGALPSPRAPL